MKISGGAKLPTPCSSQPGIGFAATRWSSGGRNPGTGGGPIVGSVLDPPKGAVVEGVKT